MGFGETLRQRFHIGRSKSVVFAHYALRASKAGALKRLSVASPWTLLLLVIRLR
jgi:hypothetical protein